MTRPRLQAVADETLLDDLAAAGWLTIRQVSALDRAGIVTVGQLRGQLAEGEGMRLLHHRGIRREWLPELRSAANAPIAALVNGPAHSEVAAPDEALFSAVRRHAGLHHLPPRTDRELLVAILRGAGNGRPRAPRWTFVRDLLSVGAGIAQALCVAAQLDPDEDVGAAPVGVADAHAV